MRTGKAHESVRLTRARATIDDLYCRATRGDKGRTQRIEPRGSQTVLERVRKHGKSARLDDGPDGLLQVRPHG